MEKILEYNMSKRKKRKNGLTRPYNFYQLLTPFATMLNLIILGTMTFKHLDDIKQTEVTITMNLLSVVFSILLNYYSYQTSKIDVEDPII